MLSTILVPLDGSPLAEQALPFAERLARAADARVILARVVPPFSVPETTIEARVSHAAQEYLEKIAARLGDTVTVVDVVVLHGDTPNQILGAAAARGADLIMMSTHGRSGIGRLLYGSVADAVLRLATLPVMLIPPNLSGAWPIERPPRILVPLDGSQLAEAVLSPAAELATRLGAELLLVDVVPWPPIVYDDRIELLAHAPKEQLAEALGYLSDVAARLRKSGASVRCHEDVGETPAATIVRVARDEHADLIAMATHGRSGLPRVVLGSTTTGTLQHASVPLLIVRPTGLQAAYWSRSETGVGRLESKA